LKRHVSEVHQNAHPLQQVQVSSEIQLAPMIFVPNIPAGPLINEDTSVLWDDLDDEYVNALDNYESKIFFFFLLTTLQYK